MITGFWGYISGAVAIAVAMVVIGFAFAVIKALFDGTIKLTYLLAEPADPVAQQAAQDKGLDTRAESDDAPAGGRKARAQPPEIPKASLSRFQFLIFTFVIAGVYLVLCLETGTFVEIPSNVVLLLGVSGGTYAASKGIKAASDSVKSAESAKAADASRPGS
jgi:hypothetical protein